MGFFKDLTWNSKHMDLRYVEDKLYRKPKITSVYTDDNNVDLDYATREFGEDIKTAQRSIDSNRVIMLVLYVALVLIPAIVMTVLTGNIYVVGAAILYAIIVVFFVEMFNQVTINQMLQKIDARLQNRHT
ncbi:MAG TPA: hypothetical protein VK068_02965 [Jeotgalicoccus sp.]|uniref:Uncharacterized protein n=1 Tax=Phocicoccus schoeneichii TaxID=1812261 RepID=A0A6V7R817_9BACL|nr:hypothetical protein [Jeotgalicoccus schoeneichii]GGH50340.1 hypothetical protein GCM10007358_07260 [Jeotgalicoccus schoeneichii]CAD2072952.1 hypothetical protein JEOSCH030_00506 [Jeotgalicoccus schoeneichii]HLR39336.1 hypothetical protein [Jeotgalicoccus sp.]